MSYRHYRQTVLTAECDADGCSETYSVTSPTRELALRWMRRKGWQIQGGGHGSLCSTHRTRPQISDDDIPIHGRDRTAPRARALRLLYNNAGTIDLSTWQASVHPVVERYLRENKLIEFRCDSDSDGAETWTVHLITAGQSTDITLTEEA